MALIAILVYLASYKFWAELPALRTLQWFHKYEAWLWGALSKSAYWRGPLGVLAIVLLPVLVVAGIQYLLYEIFILFSLIFAIIIFAAMVRPKNINIVAHDFSEAIERGELDKAQEILADCCGARPEAQRAQPVRGMVEAILEQPADRFLAVVFWLVVLGPVGAVLYRLSAESRRICQQRQEGEHGYAEAVEALHAILMWLPARLIALAYAVAGSFVDAMHAWRNQAPQWAQNWLGSNSQVMIACGMGALQIDEDLKGQDLSVTQVNAAVALVWRAMIVWMVAIAMITLAGWLV